ncbi:DUF1294 domain-containing protein [Alteribacillus iranensis]|uniref:Uncharacterized membrane protein YsdA, DUF1294 family n=1 Tax=Alteribacillus iranensis TaxID=930128 RepID=A0A1I2ED15_9BACI|nr:DUF1294 domain-containing protein [Alteribacillus iranensis]SFE90130.1 Uncharacterized membrane protein YsdA, DUF1294 family [Alteribacillus iranensis]
MKLIFGYTVIITIFSFCMMGIDKWKAIRSKHRVPENTLLTLACLGGFGGVIAGIIIFHHKVRKPMFTMLVPIIGVLEIAVFLYFFNFI